MEEEDTASLEDVDTADQESLNPSTVKKKNS